MEELYEKYLKFPNVVTDTRSPLPYSLFFALRGPNFNANEYAEKALANGSRYAVIDDVKFKKDERYILVDDVLKTLQQLAIYHRKHFKIPFIGITGSNGKTTTKELINAVLEQKYKVAYTKGNLNNHIGVPLTLLSIRKEHEIAIIEMGANNPYDIKELCDIADPDFGIITNIGKAHLEGFGNLETVEKTKCQLYDHIRNKKGRVFINETDEILLRNLNGLSTITYGINSGNTCGNEVKVNPFLSLKIKNSEGEFSIQSQMIGSYNAMNMIAAACIGNYFNVTNDLIKKGLENYNPSNNRSQLVKKENFTLLMDAYNANPSSMKAAIDNFAAIDHPSKYFILGDMFEMGEESKKEHQFLIEYVRSKKLNGIFVGKGFYEYKSNDFSFCETTEEAKKETRNIIPEKSLILIKGSRGMRLESLAELLD